MNVEHRHRTGTSILLFLLGIVVGIVALGSMRFLAQGPEQPTHYHANWALFIDGQRLDLSADRYMEDVIQCMADPANQRPEDRVHMHENNPDVVHVHAPGVTWGHLLANLGFTAGEDYLFTDRARYQADADRSLKFILNGAEVRSIQNRPIGDKDRLLISFGQEDVGQVISGQLPHLAADASHYNEMPDPASCSGAAEERLGERFRRAFWF